MKSGTLKIIYEDNHLLVIDKPAGLLTQGAEAGQDSCVTAAKAYLRNRFHKPGNVYLGVVSRLDALVTGVLVLAKTSKAAARLTTAFRDRQAKKTYLALCPVDGLPERGTWQDWLTHHDALHKVAVSHAGGAHAQLAILHFRLAAQERHVGLYRIELETGRKHQIRVQFSSHGSPLLGDAKYGSHLSFAEGIALHSWRLHLEHPTLREKKLFTAPLPGYWPKWAHSAVRALADAESQTE